MLQSVNKPMEKTSWTVVSIKKYTPVVPVVSYFFPYFFFLFFFCSEYMLMRFGKQRGSSLVSYIDIQ